MSRPKGSKNKPKDEPVELSATEVTEAAPETTQTVEEEQHELIPAHKAKSAQIEEIVKFNREQQAELDKEGDEVTEETETETPQEEKPKIEEPPAEKAPLVGKHKFTIDGKEIELTEDQIRERIQKTESADARLAKATQILEDAKRQAATLVSPQPPAKPSSEADVGDDDLIQAVTKAVLYGDEGQVTEAFTKILGKGRGPATTPKGMTPEQVQGYVRETLAYEKGLRLLETTPDQGGYADIYSDPVLKARFHQREAELRDVDKDTRPYADLYKHIGDEIRQWRDNLIKSYVPPTGLEGRDSQKRETGVIRGAGGKIPTAPAVIPKSAQEALEAEVTRQRAARGLN